MAAVKQLDLWPHEVVDRPWGGKSPRELTKGYKRFSLKPRAEKRMVEFVDPDQFDLWLPNVTLPTHTWGGSPSLLPLKGDWSWHVAISGE